MLKQIFPLLFAALLAAACSSTAPPTRHYRLPDSAVHLPERGGTAAVRVELAEPLQNNGLMYQTDAHTVNFARNNLWAEPLADSMAAALANKLNRLGGSYLPQAHADSRLPVLKVYIDRFQGHFDGRTEIGGYAQYADGRRRNFRVYTPQQGDGYDAMVDSLSGGLEEVARQIAP